MLRVLGGSLPRLTTALLRRLLSLYSVTVETEAQKSGVSCVRYTAEECQNHQDLNSVLQEITTVPLSSACAVLYKLAVVTYSCHRWRESS